MVHPRHPGVVRNGLFLFSYYTIRSENVKQPQNERQGREEPEQPDVHHPCEIGECVLFH